MSAETALPIVTMAFVAMSIALVVQSNRLRRMLAAHDTMREAHDVLWKTMVRAEQQEQRDGP